MVALRWGLVDGRARTYKEIGEAMGYTCSWANSQYTVAERRLRAMMAAEENADSFAAATGAGSSSSSSGSGSYRLATARPSPSKSADALYETNMRVRAGRQAVAEAVAG